MRRAVAQNGGNVRRKNDGSCPLLSDKGKCTIYASRPFGCRTFFCERASAKPPRKELVRLGRDILSLSERFDPKNPGARLLTLELLQ